MKERARYQLGAVIQVGDTWRFRYRETDTAGKAMRPSLLIGTLDQYPTKAKAHKAAEPLRQRVNDNAQVVYFHNLCDQFDLRLISTLRETVQCTYRSDMKRLREKWGQRRLDWMVTPQGIFEIEMWFKELRTLSRSGKSDRPLSLAARKNIRRILRQMFECGMKWGYVGMQRNPMGFISFGRLGAVLPGKRRRVMISLDQYKQLLLDPQLIPSVKVMIQLSTMTGMSRSEMLGLRWGDVSFIDGKIYIRRGCVEGHVEETKTMTRAGSYPLHPRASKLLLEWKKEARSMNGWVLESALTGKPFIGSALQSDHLVPAGRRIGIEMTDTQMGLGFHHFRHLYRKLMGKLGATPEEQKKAMRHANIATTMDVYGNDDDARAEEVRPINAKVVEMLPRIDSAHKRTKPGPKRTATV